MFESFSMKEENDHWQQSRHFDRTCICACASGRVYFRMRLLAFLLAYIHSLMCLPACLPAFNVVCCIYTNMHIPYRLKHQKLESMLLHNFYCTNKVHLPLVTICGVLGFYLLLLLMLCCVCVCGSVAVLLFAVSLQKLRTGYRYVEFSFVIHIQWYLFIVLELRMKRMLTATSFGLHLKFFDLTLSFRSFNVYVCVVISSSICSN